MLVGSAVIAARKQVSDGVKRGEIVEIANFPYAFDQSGRCENLQSDNSCAIYETRPDICSVDRTFKKYHAANMSRAKYYQISEQSCKNLQKAIDG